MIFTAILHHESQVQDPTSVEKCKPFMAPTVYLTPGSAGLSRTAMQRLLMSVDIGQNLVGHSGTVLVPVCRVLVATPLVVPS